MTHKYAIGQVLRHVATEIDNNRRTLWLAGATRYVVISPFTETFSHETIIGYNCRMMRPSGEYVATAIIQEHELLPLEVEVQT